MAREEVLDERQSELVRSVVRALVREHGTQARVGELAGLSQQTISKILNSRDLVGLRAAIRLVDSGLLDLFALFGRVPAERLTRVAKMLAQPAEVVVSAWEASGEGALDAVRQLPETVQRAAMAVVYLDRRNVSETYAAAAAALEELGLEYAPTAVDAWLQPIRDRLPKRPASGVRPSSRPFKVSAP